MDQRLIATSAVRCVGNTLILQGRVYSPPYRITAIGDPKTLDTALNIPGGVAATARAAGGELTVRELPQVRIAVTRTLPPPKYAQPSR